MSDDVASSSALVPSVDRAALSLLGLNSAVSSSGSCGGSANPLARFRLQRKVPRPPAFDVGLLLRQKAADNPPRLYFRCPCGWTPPHVRAFEAGQRHWRQCQGRNAPSAPPNHKRWYPAARSHSASPEAQRLKTISNYQSWLAKFSVANPTVAASLCVPNFDVPQKAGKRKTYVTYVCKRCGAWKTPFTLFFRPCAKTSAGKICRRVRCGNPWLRCR